VTIGRLSSRYACGQRCRTGRGPPDHPKGGRLDAAVGDVCADGAPQCVAATISQMRTRFEPLGRACDHNAAFALTYLRTTQTYQWARDRPGFFADVAGTNHESALFAQYYFGRRCVIDWQDVRRRSDERSDRRSEFGECAGNPAGGQYLVSEFVVAAAEVLDEGVPCDDYLRGSVTV
jgi:hypothetical protein